MVQLSLSLLSSFQFLPQYKKEPTIKSQNMIEIKIKKKKLNYAKSRYLQNNFAVVPC